MVSSRASFYKPETSTATVIRKLEQENTSRVGHVGGQLKSECAPHYCVSTRGAHAYLSAVAELNKAASKGCSGILLPGLVTMSALQKSQRLVTMLFSLTAQFLFHSCRK